MCSPNGLALFPRKVHKALKMVFSLLRQQWHISVAYIDNSWLTADNLYQCTKNVIDSTSSLDKVGFVIHPEKSVLPLTDYNFPWFCSQLCFDASFTDSRQSFKIKICM